MNRKRSSRFAQLDSSDFDEVDVKENRTKDDVIFRKTSTKSVHNEKRFSMSHPYREYDDEIPAWGMETGVVKDRIDEKKHNAPYIYSMLCFLILLWSSLGMGIVVSLHFFGDTSNKYSGRFIEIDRRFPTAPAYLMFTAASIGIVSGLLGISVILVRWSTYLYIFNHVLWVTGAIYALAALYAVGIDVEPTMGSYHRLFEASALSMIGDFEYIDLWGKEFRDTWKNIQYEMQCCGIFGPQDWLQTPYQKIPLTCCTRFLNHECKQELSLWNELPAKEKILGNVKHLLNTEGCLNSVRVERGAMRWDWMIYPSIVFIFHTITTVKLNSVVNILETQFGSVRGMKYLKQFRRNLLGRFVSLFCYPWKALCRLCTRITQSHQVVGFTEKAPAFSEAEN